MKPRTLEQEAAESTVIAQELISLKHEKSDDSTLASMKIGLSSPSLSHLTDIQKGLEEIQRITESRKPESKVDTKV